MTSRLAFVSGLFVVALLAFGFASVLAYSANVPITKTSVSVSPIFVTQTLRLPNETATVTANVTQTFSTFLTIISVITNISPTTMTSTEILTTTSTVTLIQTVNSTVTNP